MPTADDILTQMKELTQVLRTAFAQPPSPAPERRTLSAEAAMTAAPTRRQLTAYAYSDPGGETVARMAQGLELASDGPESRDLAATVPTPTAMEELVAAAMRGITPPAARPELNATATGSKRMVGNCYGTVQQPNENAALVWTRGQ